MAKKQIHYKELSGKQWQLRKRTLLN